MKAQGRINYKYFFFFISLSSGASRVAQTVKNPPAVQETQVRSLDREDALGEGKATLGPWGHRMHTAERLTLLGLVFVSYD